MMVTKNIKVPQQSHLRYVYVKYMCRVDFIAFGNKNA